MQFLIELLGVKARTSQSRFPLCASLSKTLSKLKIRIILIIFLLSIFTISCKKENHIDKYGLTLEKLNQLPDYFYAHRRGNIYFENQYYRIWFNRTLTGDIKNIFEIEDLKKNELSSIQTSMLYNIDTANSKRIAQNFIDLSNKFKFGHLNLDRKNKVSFSYRDGLAEQYVKPLNDSVKNLYLKNQDFKLLNNGWFEYQGE